MKKILFTLLLVFSFTISAVAQDKNSEILAAKKEISALTDMIGLTSEQGNTLYTLFIEKYKNIKNINLSEERKNEVRKVCDSKVEAILTDTQKQKFNAMKEEYKKLKTKLESN